MGKYIGLIVLGMLCVRPGLAYTICTAVGGVEIHAANRYTDAQTTCDADPEKCNNMK